AADRGFSRALRWRDPGRRSPCLLEGPDAAAGAAQHVDDLSELRVVAAYDGNGKHRLRPAAAENGPRHDREEARRDPCHDKTRGAGAALPRRIVRWTATARGTG